MMANVFGVVGLALKVLIWASVIIGLLVLVGFVAQEVKKIIDLWKEFRHGKS